MKNENAFFAALVIAAALLITDIVQTTIEKPANFNPIIEHSEIKAIRMPVIRYRAEWVTIHGDQYGSIRPYTDTILFENY